MVFVVSGVMIVFGICMFAVGIMTLLERRNLKEVSYAICALVSAILMIMLGVCCVLIMTRTISVEAFL